MKKTIYAFIIMMMPALLVLSGKTVPIDKNFLLSEKFTFGRLLASGNLIFKKDGWYSIEYSSPGITWYDQGSYNVKNNTIQLKSKGCYYSQGGSALDCSRSMGDAACVLEAAPNDLYYDKYLYCASEKNSDVLSLGISRMPFRVESSRVTAGAFRTHSGVPVVTMGSLPGVTTAGVKIRKMPSVNSKALDFMKEIYGGEPLKSVPEKTELVIVARTSDRDRVQSWNNYWYLVNVGFMTEVWMYGEFVKIK